MKISWRDRDAIFSIDGMRDSFEIDIGMWDLQGGIGIEILKVAR